MKRRQLLSLSAATAALAFPAVSRAQDKRFAGITLRMNGYGGDWDRVIMEQIAQPLERKTGLKTVLTPGTATSALAKVMAAPDDPPFDILMADSPGMPDVLKGQFVRSSTTTDIKGLARVLAGMREFGDLGVPLIVSSSVLAFNTNRVKSPLKSYADLARPDLKDRTALFSVDNGIGLLQLIAMAQANGGSLENIGPGIAALARLKPNAATITNSTVNMVQLLQQEEIWAAPHLDGRIISLQQAGKPIAMVEPAEGTYSLITYLNPLKASKHPDAVHAFLEESLSGDFCLGIANFFGYRPAIDVRLPPEVAKKLYTPNRQRHVDWTQVAANRAAWVTLFNKAMGA